MRRRMGYMRKKIYIIMRKKFMWRRICMRRTKD